MKKTAGILALAIFASLLAIPRSAAADIRFGFKGGVNMAKVVGDDAQINLSDLKNKVAFSGGVFVSFSLGKYLAIQPEILYTMKGSKTEYMEGDVETSAKLKYSYLEIPLLLKLRIPLGPFAPFIFAGPSVGFLVNDALIVRENSEGATGEQTLNMPTMDYGAIAGVGLELGEHFWVDVRVSKGLKKIIEDNGTGDLLDVKNSVFTASLSIVF